MEPESSNAPGVPGRGVGWAKGLTAETDDRVKRMVLARVGKPNWARGLTAATDPRIAKQAATRRGKRRGPYRIARKRTGRCRVLPITVDRESSYAYLLGMYLGDGHIARVRRGYVFSVYLDAKYPGIAERCADAVRLVNPFHRTRLARRRNENVLRVSACGVCWPEIFPQHGPGRKHTRPIVLADWQRDIVRHEPMSFLRGLMESDGSRYVRHVDGRDYGAYDFDNRSQDILALFCWACDLLGVGYTRPNRFRVTIARKGNVARLDDAFGVKA